MEPDRPLTKQKNTLSYWSFEKINDTPSYFFKTGDNKEFTWQIILMKSPNGFHFFLILHECHLSAIVVACRWLFVQRQSPGTEPSSLPFTFKKGDVHLLLNLLDIGDHELIDIDGIGIEIRHLIDVEDFQRQVDINHNAKENFKKFLFNKMLSDVKFVTMEGTIFAHKVIMAARSSVYAEMFAECSMDKDLVPYDRAVFEEWLNFLYTGRTWNTRRHAKELLKLSNKYELPDLKALCESCLHKHLSIENAIETLKFCDRNNAPELKKLTREFIAENGKDIIHTQDLCGGDMKWHVNIALDVMRLAVDHNALYRKTRTRLKNSLSYWSLKEYNIDKLNIGDMYTHSFKTGDNLEYSWEASLLKTLTGSSLYLTLKNSVHRKIEGKCCYLLNDQRKARNVCFKINKGDELFMFNFDHKELSRFKNITFQMEVKRSPRIIIDQICDFPLNTLVDFGKLVGGQFLSDVKLITIGGTIFAHKVILAARSPVFAAMFSNDMEEKLTDEIEIPAARDAVEEMLHFIYSSRLKNIVGHEMVLLELSNKYDLPDLKVVCEGALYRKLNVENAFAILKLCDVHNTQELRSRTTKFIEEHAKSIPGSRDFIEVLKWKSQDRSQCLTLAETEEMETD